MIIESLHDRSINKQNMHAFTLYHISLQRKIHVNSITYVQDSITFVQDSISVASSQL